MHRHREHHMPGRSNKAKNRQASGRALQTIRSPAIAVSERAACTGTRAAACALHSTSTTGLPLCPIFTTAYSTHHLSRTSSWQHAYAGFKRGPEEHMDTKPHICTLVVAATLKQSGIPGSSCSKRVRQPRTSALRPAALPWRTCIGAVHYQSTHTLNMAP